MSFSKHKKYISIILIITLLFSLSGTSVHASIDDINVSDTTINKNVETTSDDAIKDESSNSSIPESTEINNTTQSPIETPVKPITPRGASGKELLGTNDSGSGTSTTGTSYYNNTFFTITNSASYTVKMNGVEKTVTDNITVNTALTVTITLDNLDIEIPDDLERPAIDIKGTANVTLILKGQNTIKSGKLNAGINMSPNAKLTIKGNGELNVIGGHGAAGIGGSYNNDGNNITITDSAKVNAYAPENVPSLDGGTAIGGGENGASQNITINGNAEVHAETQGDNFSAAIGAGTYQNAKNIKIGGDAKVTAKARYGAGIGGGYLSGFEGYLTENIEISGNANVTSTSEYGAGIGGGFDGGGVSGVNILDNSVVKARGGEKSAGIGGAGTNYDGLERGQAENINIHSKGVSAVGGIDNNIPVGRGTDLRDVEPVLTPGLKKITYYSKNNKSVDLFYTATTINAPSNSYISNYESDFSSSANDSTWGKDDRGYTGFYFQNGEISSDYPTELYTLRTPTIDEFKTVPESIASLSVGETIEVKLKDMGKGVNHSSTWISGTTAYVKVTNTTKGALVQGTQAIDNGLIQVKSNVDANIKTNLIFPVTRDIFVYVAPKSVGITYGNKLELAQIYGGMVWDGIGNVTGTWRWENPDMIPDAGTSVYKAIFTPSDSNLTTLEYDVSVTVSKAFPLLNNSPVASDISYGQTVSNSVISEYSFTGVDGNNIPGVFAWDESISQEKPTVGSKTYKATFTPTGVNAGNYQAVSYNLPINVTKGKVEIVEKPVASDIKYKQKVSSSTISGGTVELYGTPVEGEWKWIDSTAQPNVGVSSQQAIFIPNDYDSGNIDYILAYLDLKTNAIPLVLEESPSASSITYGDKMEKSILSGGAVTADGEEVSGTWAWKYNAVRPAGYDKYTAVFTANDPNYGIGEWYVYLTINKRVPDLVKEPKASEITYGSIVSDSAISDYEFKGAYNADVPGTIQWDSSVASIKPNAGTTTYKAIFIPNGSNKNDYESVELDIALKVNKATPVISTVPSASTIKYGKLITASTLVGGYAEYNGVKVNGMWVWANPTTKPNVGITQHTLIFKPTGEDRTNYTTASALVNVNTLGIPLEVKNLPTASSITYGDDLSKSTLSGGLVTAETTEIDGTWSWKDSGAVSSVGEKEYTAVFTATDTNYGTIESDIKVKIGQGTPKMVAAPSASAITYGSIVSDSVISGYKFKGTNNEDVQGTVSWDTSVESDRPNAGTTTYNAIFTPNGDNKDYYKAVELNIELKINKMTPVVKTKPVSSGIRYGSIVSDSTLSWYEVTGYDGNPISGTFRWDETIVNEKPNAGTASYSAIFTPDGDDKDNYTSVSTDVSLNISKATPETTTKPDASSIKYRQSLADSNLTGGVVEFDGKAVEGTWAWKDGTIKPVVGKEQFTAVFTPTGEKAGNYKSIEAKIDVTTESLGLKVDKAPSASAITYGDSLAKSTFTGGTVSADNVTVEGTWAWKDSSIVSPAGEKEYTAVFTATDTNYGLIESKVIINVKKRTPEIVTAPSASVITYGSIVSNSVITGYEFKGLNDEPVQGTVTWDATVASTKPNAGTDSHKAIFTPNGLNASNYGPVSLNIEIKVSAATPVVTILPVADDINYRQIIGNSNISGGTVEYDGVKITGIWAWTAPLEKPNVGTAQYEAVFTPTSPNPQNYETVKANLSVTTNPLTLVVDKAPTASTITYGDALSKSNLTGGAVSADNIAVEGTWIWKDSSIVSPAGEKEYTAVFTAKDTNYGTIESNVKVNVDKRTPEIVTNPSASTITYGSIVSDSAITGYEFKGLNDEPVQGTVIWDSSIASDRPDAGTTTYKAIFTPNGDNKDNYKSVELDIKLAINKAKPVISTEPNATGITYGSIVSDSKLSGYTVNGYDGNSITGTFVWDEAIAGDKPNAGTATYRAIFTLSGDFKDNYTSTSTNVEFNVAQATPEVTTKPEASNIKYRQSVSDSNLTGGVVEFDGKAVEGTWDWKDDSVKPEVGSEQFAAVFTPTGEKAGNYKSIEAKIDVTTEALELKVDKAPSASAITYGDNLVKSTLTGGAVSADKITVEGTWTWKDSSIVSPAGEKEYVAVFTATNTNYGTIESNVKVSVAKRTPEMITAPSASTITYGSIVSDSVITGYEFQGLNDEPVQGTVTWDSSISNDRPDAGTTTYKAIFSPSGDNKDNYKSVELDIKLVINKAKPVISTEPNATGITYGSIVSDSKLSGYTVNGYDGNPITGTFVWDESIAGNKPNAGTATYKAIFTPNGDFKDNYTSTSTNVEFNVAQATPEVTTKPEASNIKYRQSLAGSNLTDGLVEFDGKAVEGTWTWKDNTIKPIVGSEQFTAVFTPTGEKAGNYKSIEAKIDAITEALELSVDKAPSSSAITYGDILSKSALTGGAVSADKIAVEGTWTWKDSSIVSPAGEKEYAAVFTATDTNYGTIEYEAKVDVKKRTPEMVTAPSASTITYGSIVSDSAITGYEFQGLNDEPVQGIVTWDSSISSDRPDAGTTTCKAIFSPNGDNKDNYKSVELELGLSVNKAKPVISTEPNATGITYGSIVSDSKLSGYTVNGYDDKAITGTFVWDDAIASEKPDAGTATYKAIFTPSGAFRDNYTSTSTNVEFNVAQATPEATTKPVASNIKYRQSLSDSNLTGGVVEFDGKAVEGTWDWKDDSVKPEVGSEQFAAVFTPTGEKAGNYKSIETKIDVTTEALELKVDKAPSASAITYGDSLAKSSLTGGAVSADKIAVDGTWTWKDSSIVSPAGDKEYTAVFTATDTNYGTIESNVKVSVAKRTPEIVTAPSASVITYGNIVSDSAITNYEFKGLNDEPVQGNVTWDSSIANDRPDAGTATYKAIFTPSGDNKDNYKSVELELGLTVNKVKPVIAIEPEATSITYGSIVSDSKMSRYVVNGYDGNPITGTFVWDDAIASEKPDAGTATYKAIFTPSGDYKDNYTSISANVEFDVAKATPEVTTKPVASSIKYRQSLADSNLTDGLVEFDGKAVEGTWTWKDNTIKPIVGSEKFIAVFTPTGEKAGNYKPIEAKIDVTTEALELSVDKAPSSSAITYGDILAKSALTGGAVSADKIAVEGTWTWKDSSIVSPAGEKEYTAVFTATDTNYGIIESNVKVSVAKRTPEIISAPSASTITYGSIVSDSAITGYEFQGLNDEPVQGTVTWDSSIASVRPDAGTTTYKAIFTPNGDNKDNYKSVELDIKLVVNKAKPVISTEPNATGITYGSIVSNSKLSGYTVNGYDDKAITGTFVWDEAIANEKPDAGTAIYKAIFTPSGDFNDNYTSISIDVEFEVAKAIPEATTKPIASNIKYRQSLSDSNLTGGVVEFDGKSVEGTWAWKNSATKPAVGTTQFDAVFTPVGDQSHNYMSIDAKIDVTTESLYLTVDKNPSASAITYGDNLKKSLLTGGAVIANNVVVEGTWSWKDSSIVSPAGEKEYTAVFTATDTNYGIIESNVKVSVAKRTPEIISAPSASTITYGSIVSDSAITGYEFQGLNDEPVQGTVTWDSSIASVRPDAGTTTYKAIFTPNGDNKDNYKSVELDIKLVVNKAKPVISTEPNATGITYGSIVSDSKLSGYTVNGYDGNPITGTFVWDEAIAGNKPNAGTATYKAIFTPNGDFKDNYTSTSTNVEFNVAKATPEVTTKPVASSIKYRQSLDDSNLTGGVVKFDGKAVEGTWTWKDNTIKPIVGSEKFTAVFTPTGEKAGNYKSIEAKIDVTTEALELKVDKSPSASAITYGDSLAKSALIGGAVSADKIAVEGTWTWKDSSIVSPAGDKEYTAVFTATDTNYGKIEYEVKVDVKKRTPEMISAPSASAITYGSIVSDSAITGYEFQGLNDEPVQGTVTWDSSIASVRPDAGTTTYKAIFTPNGDNKDNYKSVELELGLSVNKAKPVIAIEPKTTSITYGSIVSDSKLSGYTVNGYDGNLITGTFVWDDAIASEKPDAGTATYKAIFTPSGDFEDNYTSTSTNVEFNVAKATPEVTTKPVASSIKYRQSLADSNLSGGIVEFDGNAVEGTWAWKDDSVKPEVGSEQFTATFTPTGNKADNFKSIEAKIDVTTESLELSVDKAPSASAITYGDSLAKSTLTGGAVSADKIAVEGTWSWKDSSIVSPAGDKEYTAVFTATDKNYGTIESNVKVSVAKRTPEIVTAPSASAITYGNIVSDSAITNYEFKGLNDEPVQGNVTWDSSIANDRPNAGTATYKAIFSPSGDNKDNYKSVELNIEISISSATPIVITVPSASGLDYGQALEDSILTGGYVEFDGKEVTGNWNWKNKLAKPLVGTAKYEAIFTPTGNNAGNFKEVLAPVEVETTSLLPGVEVLPSASAITYGDKLEKSSLTGGKVSVNNQEITGTWAWKDSSIVSSAGNKSHKAIFTATDTNYGTLETDVNVLVNKRLPEMTKAPSASAITYGSIVSDSKLTGYQFAGLNNEEVQGTITWDNSIASERPETGTATYKAVFTPNGNNKDNYAKVELNVELKVNKTKPAIGKAPVASPITYGAVVSTSTISGYEMTGIDGDSVEGTWTWDNSIASEKPNAGEKAYKAIFTPNGDDHKNYEAIETTITLTINQAMPIVKISPVADNIKYRQLLSDSQIRGGSVESGENTVNGMWTWTAPGEKPNVGNSQYDAIYTPTGQDAINYKTVTAKVNVFTEALELKVETTPSASAVTYGDSLEKSTLTGGAVSADSIPVEGSWTWKDSGIVSPAGEHEYIAVFTATDANYGTKESGVIVDVKKRSPKLEIAPKASEITYGSIVSDSKITGYRFTGLNDEEVNGTVTWHPSIASEKPNAGEKTYKAIFTPTGDNAANYKEEELNVDFKINKRTPDISSAPEATAITYGNKVADSRLEGYEVTGAGGEKIEGKFSWDGSILNEEPEAGTVSYKAIFVPGLEYVNNYTNLEAEVELTINKKEPEMVKTPKTFGITYGDTLSESEITDYEFKGLNDENVPGEFDWNATDASIKPKAGTRTFRALFVPNGDNQDNYSVYETDLEVTIDPATPNVEIIPSGTAIDYRQTLESSTIKNGYVEYDGKEVEGTWSWKNETIKPNVGTFAYDAVFTPTGSDAENYNSVTEKVSVTINPLELVVDKSPSASDIKYGDKLSSSKLAGGKVSADNIEVDGSWQWEDTGILSDAGEKEYTAVFTATDFNYGIKESKVKVTVEKRAPKMIDSPEATNITYGSIVSESALSSYKFTGLNDVELTGTVTWNANDAMETPNAGKYMYLAVFTPNGKYTNNYEPYEVLVSLEVDQAEPTITTIPTAKSINYRQLLSDAKLTGGVVEYKSKTVNGFWTWENSQVKPNVGVTSYKAIFTPTGSDSINYTSVSTNVDVETKALNLVIDKLPVAKNIVYGEDLSKSTLTGGKVSADEIEVEGVWSWEDAGISPDAGPKTYKAVFTADDKNYGTKDENIDITVEKRIPVVSVAPKASEITYGSIISDSTISGYEFAGINDEEVKGTLNWDSSQAQIGPDAGKAKYKAVFTPANEFKSNYSNAEVEIEVVTNKMIPTVSDRPVASGIKYGETVSKSTISGYKLIGNKNEMVPGVYEWKSEYKNEKPDAGIATYSAIFTPNGANSKNYASVETDITFEVSPAKPVITTKPVADNLKYRQELSESVLRNGYVEYDGVQVVGTWSWVSGYMKPNVGEADYEAVFTPTGNKAHNYISVSTSVKVVTNPLTLVVDQPPSAGAIVYGNKLEKSTLSGGKVSADNIEVKGTWKWKNENLISSGGEKEYTVIFTANDENYGSTETKTKVIIGKIKPTKVDDPISADISYGSKVSESVISEYKFEGLNGEKIPGTMTWDDSDKNKTPEVGTHTFKAVFTPNGVNQDNYFTVDVNVELTVNKIDAQITKLPDTNNIKYGQPLNDSKLENGKVEYKGETVDGSWAWKNPNQIPSGGNKYRNYQAVFKPDDKDHYKTLETAAAVYIEGSKDASITVTDDEFDKNDPEDIVLDFDNGTYTFVGMRDNNNNLIENIDYELNDNKLIIKKEYIEKQTDGQHTIEVIMDDGINPSFKLNIKNSAFVNKPVTSIKMNVNSTTMYTGGSYRLTATVNADATDKSVKWSSTNPGVARVDSNGTVYAGMVEGTAVITARSGNKSASSYITVVQNVTKIRTPITHVYLSYKKSVKLPVVLDNGNTEVKSKLTFTSSNPKVVTVDSAGKLKAKKKKGKAIITIRTASGKTLNIKVKVGKKKTKVKKVKIKGIKKKMKVGATAQIKVKLNPKKATNVKVTFKSSKKGVATVDKAGKIIAKKKGKTTITVKAGGKKVKKKIVIK